MPISLNLLKTSTFRLAAAYLFVFVLSVAAILPTLDRLPVRPSLSASPQAGESPPPSDPAPLRSVVLLI